MRTVTILTHSYLNGYSENASFARPFGGGLERYMHDLCGVIQSKGWQAVVHQLSFFGNFETVYEGTRVRGFTYELNAIAEAFDRMADAADGLVVYASCIWHPIAYRPGSIGICHGINWDWPPYGDAVKTGVASMIQRAVSGLDRLVSVDSHFLTYCRAVCTFDDPERIVLLPNAVDTEWFAGAAGNPADLEDFVLDGGLPVTSADGADMDRLGAVGGGSVGAVRLGAGGAANEGTGGLGADNAANEGTGGLGADSAANEGTGGLGADSAANEGTGGLGADSAANEGAVRLENAATVGSVRLGARDSENEAAGACGPGAGANLLQRKTAGTGGLRLLFPRRLSYERGIVPMMLIADRLLAEFPALTIEFAGEIVDGTPVAIAWRMWRQYQPHRDRILHRTYGFQEVREAYRAADVVVIPTVYSEGTSLSCLEAMSCGCAIVASNVGGLNDLITSGYNGILAAPTVDALHVAVKALLEQASLRRQFGEAARQTAKAFDLKRWQKQWDAVLEEQFARLGN